jgi:hypothetical protein
MVAETIFPQLEQHLSPPEGASMYAVVDGAATPRLLDKLYGLRPKFECLFRGALEPDMAEVAPYLVRVEPGTPFATWLLESGWGNHCCIYAASAAGLDEVKRHLRAILVVHDPSGKPLYFRFYDPRVLRKFAPVCKPEDLDALFGPIRAFLLEDEDASKLLRFEVAGDQLRAERVELDA